MMATKKNESKTKKTAKVAADAAAHEQNATAAVENTAANAEEPAAEPEVPVIKDDATEEAVTVVVALTSPENDALMLRHCLRSLVKNLRGVKATVKVVGKVKPSWLPDGHWVECSDTFNSGVAVAVEQAADERIVVMTDRMMLANPVLLADIDVHKADEKQTETTKMLAEAFPDRKFYNFDVNMPVKMLRSLLLDVLGYAEKYLKPGYDIATVYFNLVFDGHRPVFVHWPTDGWLLPVVSSKPDQAKMAKFLATKKFIHFFESADGDGIVSTLKFLTPDPTEFETDVENADTVED